MLNASETVEQLKKYHAYIQSFVDDVLWSGVKYFFQSNLLQRRLLQCTNSRFCVVTNLQTVT